MQSQLLAVYLQQATLLFHVSPCKIWKNLIYESFFLALLNSSGEMYFALSKIYDSIVILVVY
jgi:hypothetical protein